MSDLIRRDEAIKEIKKLADYYADKQAKDSSQFFVGEEDGCYSAIHILEEMKPVGHSTNKKDMEALIEDINPKEIASHIETDTLSNWCEILRHELIRTLNKMERIEEPKTGHWIGTEYDGYADGYPVYDVYECSECGMEYDATDDGEITHNYCPNCGAKMERSKE